jgi:hypothetical protein
MTTGRLVAEHGVRTYTTRRREEDREAGNPAYRIGRSMSPYITDAETSLVDDPR